MLFKTTNKKSKIKHKLSLIAIFLLSPLSSRSDSRCVSNRAQSGIILNVQHQLEDILNTQNLIVKNQSEMMSKLNAIESRLSTVEKCLIVQQQQQQVALPLGKKQQSSLQSSPRHDAAKSTVSVSGGVVIPKDRISQKQVSPSHSMIAAAVSLRVHLASVSNGSHFDTLVFKGNALGFLVFSLRRKNAKRIY